MAFRSPPFERNSSLILCKQLNSFSQYCAIWLWYAFFCQLQPLVGPDDGQTKCCENPKTEFLCNVTFWQNFKKNGLPLQRPTAGRGGGVEGNTNANRNTNMHRVFVFVFVYFMCVFVFVFVYVLSVCVYLYLYFRRICVFSSVLRLHISLFKLLVFVFWEGCVNHCKTTQRQRWWW